MPRTTAGRLAAALIVAITLIGVTLSSVLAKGDELAAVKAATARFHDVEQAIAAGYGLPPAGPLHECIASFDGTGAMGYHYINGALLSGDEAAVSDPERPEALVYAPDRNGKLKLVAIEYVIFDEALPGGAEMPMLFGQDFMFTDAPNRYEIPPFWALHAWVWQNNPAGTFTSFNPSVSC